MIIVFLVIFSKFTTTQVEVPPADLIALGFSIKVNTIFASSGFGCKEATLF